MTAGSKLLNALSAVALSSTILAASTLAVSFGTVGSAQAAVVNRVEVRGTSRVDAETVRNLSQISPGQNVTAADMDKVVTRLFATGLFSDVRVSQSGGTLIVQVDENQIVNEVIFQGNKKVKNEQLEAVVQTTPRAAYNASTAQADVDAIRAVYSRVGRSDANVSVRTIQAEGNRVNVVFDVAEGDRTRIAQINFVGNNAFGDSRLKEVIALRQTGLLGFMQRSDIYDEDRLRADEETLRRFYYNRGFADFRIVSSVAELDEAKNEYYLTITIEEGERYSFGAVNIDSTVPGIDAASLQNELDTKTGATYSAEKVEDTLVNLTNAVAAQGYAFAQVTPRGDRDFSNNTIAVEYVIDQGPRAYIERIEVRGNNKTRDYVIRREFDVSEGDAFNQVLIQRARQRLEALRFFQTVNVSTAPGSEPDRVIVVVQVVEQSTGEFSIGGGYTTGGENPGPVAEISITERNFLGRGQFVRVSAGFGEDARNYTLSFTEPYFLGRRLAAGFDIYRVENSSSDYDIERTGGTLRLAAPITENLTAQIAYNYKEERFGDDYGVPVPGPGGSVAYRTCGDFISATPASFIGQYSPMYTNSPIINQAICDSPYSTSSASYSLTYNTLDNNNDPRDGLFLQAGQEIAGLGGDAQFVRTTGKGSFFSLLNEEYDVIGLLGGSAGNVTAFGGDLRVFDNFFKGQDIVRGFKYQGIGPRQNGVSIGGENFFNATAEVTFPLPLVSRDLGFRGAAFADVGSLWGSEYDDQPGVEGTGFDIRASAGVGLVWASPFGPIRVNYAYPIAKEDFDRTQEFSFGFSSRF
ncbi:outer membrane protein assembly factor BamA [Aureimonas fodinaquatilis]|uniref:Outer membrane protein assembly factor BamA n=1 Tax=Aureimonas fodinaquatilis TaxID=2565783 RepID=A0A5B0DVP5_9HYPH|nr:outer membrane protein assembly factor BamA [Aureimonas fodinaquatilis]KAA0970493.1 outer membrane protein assembly factor BamA [Aureimonas fodinaquatilis]